MGETEAPLTLTLSLNPLIVIFTSLELRFGAIARLLHHAIPFQSFKLKIKKINF